MAFKGYSYNKEIIGDVGSGEGNIQTSGLYPITIDRVEFKETDNQKYTDGVRQEFIIAYTLNGKSGYLYGLPINKVDGEMNQRTQKIMNNLMSIVGLFKDLSQPVKTQVTRKNGDVAEVLHFKELAGKEVIVYIKAKYRKWQGKIFKDLQIVDFFQKSTKASVGELLLKDPNKYGKRYEDMKAKGYDKQIEYDGVTEEEAKQWEDSQRNQSGNAATPEVGQDDEIPF